MAEKKQLGPSCVPQFECKQADGAGDRNQNRVAIRYTESPQDDDNMQNLDSDRSTSSAKASSSVGREDRAIGRETGCPETSTVGDIDRSTTVSYAPKRLNIRALDSGSKVSRSAVRGLNNFLSGPWGSGFKAPPNPARFQRTTSIKMSYFTLKENIDDSERNSAPLLAMQLSQKESRFTSISNSSMGGDNSPNSCRSLQRSPGRRWNHEDGQMTHDEKQVNELMKRLEECKKQCEKDGRYLEASAAAKRLQALKLFEDNKKRERMLERHMKERERAEAAYKTEIKQKAQNFLGKQGKYLEAQEVKKLADRMEFTELQSTLAAYQTEVSLKEQALRAKQQTEMGILLQKVAQTRDELRRSKEEDLERCYQRHRNAKRDLQAWQKQECFKLDVAIERRLAEFRALGGDLRHLSTTTNGLGGLKILRIGNIVIEETVSSTFEIDSVRENSKPVENQRHIDMLPRNALQ